MESKNETNRIKRTVIERKKINCQALRLFQNCLINIIVSFISPDFTKETIAVMVAILCNHFQKFSTTHLLDEMGYYIKN
jgi:ethanolamine ammonia-lyase large subunit